VVTTGGLQWHGGLVIGVNGGLIQSKSKLTQGLGTWSGWLALGGPVALNEAQFCNDASPHHYPLSLDYPR